MSFDLGFRSMLIKEIVEDKGSLWTEGIISWISINRGSSQGKRVQVVGGDSRPCVGLLLGTRSFERLVSFPIFVSN